MFVEKGLKAMDSPHIASEDIDLIIKDTNTKLSLAENMIEGFEDNNSSTS